MSKKRKVIISILALMVLAVGALFILKGCQKEEPVVHIHSYKINEEGTWMCAEDGDILSNTDRPYVAILENNQPKDIMAINSLSKTKINLGNGTIYKENNNIYYSGNNAQTIIIKTQKVDDKQKDKDNLVINAPNDTVYHYGSSTVISLDAVATNSFHEYGKVDLITLTKARIVLENKSDVKEIYLDINNDNYSYETTIIALKEDVELPRLTRDAVDLEEGEVKTLAIVQKLKDEVKTETNEETNEVIETVLEVQAADDNYVKIENVRKSDDELIVEAFLSPNADEQDKTQTQNQTTSTVTLEEAKEGSNHPASFNTFVSKEEKVTEVVKPIETKEEPEQEETKPVITPVKKEEEKKEEELPVITHTHSYGTWYEIDGIYHGKKCNCGDIIKEEHVFDSSDVCTKCGFVKPLVLPESLTIGDGEELPFEYKEGMIFDSNKVIKDGTKLYIIDSDNTGTSIVKASNEDEIGCTITINKFHDGEGNEQNPYIVINARQFNNIKNYEGKKYYKLDNDIDLSSLSKTNSNTYGFDSLKGQLISVVLDGNNHSIVSTSNAIDTIIGDFVYSTIKNVTFNTATPIVGYIQDSTFENVNVVGNNTMYFGNNTGIMAIYCSSADFNNVNVSANVVGSSYNGVFMGYCFGEEYNLINCSYAGNFVSVYSGLVFGNPTYYNATINIKNFINNGIIRHTNVNDSVSKNYCLYGICSDGQYQSKTVSIDDVDYSGDKSKEYNLSGAGQYIIGPVDDGLSITLNQDKTFTITKSSDETVSYYEVEIVANVANLGPYGGSTNISVMETINSDGSDSYTTTLKDYGFANGNEPTGKLGDVDIINIEGIDYYWESNPNYYCGSRGNETVIFVRTYNSERTLISVTTLLRGQ